MNSNLYQMKPCECVISCWLRLAKRTDISIANADNDSYIEEL
jgi:hypothetical protein